MIQRIQTIYLILAALLLGFLFLPVFDFVNTNVTGNQSIFSDGALDIFDDQFLMILIGFCIGCLAINIFLYKNRKLQSSVALISVFGVLATLIYATFLLIQYNKTVGTTFSNFTPGLGLLSTFVSAILTLLARGRIKKDDNLVKSMDRLR